MYRMAWSGSQNEARRVWSSLTVGCLPSRRRSGARESHSRIAFGSIETLGCGAGNSTMKTPGPLPMIGRPHRTGPSTWRPTASSRSRPLSRGAGDDGVVTREPCLPGALLSNGRLGGRGLMNEGPGESRGLRAIGRRSTTCRGSDPRAPGCPREAGAPHDWCRSGGSDRCCTSTAGRPIADPDLGSEAGSGCTCRRELRPSGR
jgi:hypothetical protein